MENYIKIAKDLGLSYSEHKTVSGKTAYKFSSEKHHVTFYNEEITPSKVLDSLLKEAYSAGRISALTSSRNLELQKLRALLNKYHGEIVKQNYKE